MSNISRRKFLKGAGVAALAVAAAGVLAGCSDKDPIIPSETKKKVTLAYYSRSKGKTFDEVVIEVGTLVDTISFDTILANKPADTQDYQIIDKSDRKIPADNKVWIDMKLVATAQTQPVTIEYYTKVATGDKKLAATDLEGATYEVTVEAQATKIDVSKLAPNGYMIDKSVENNGAIENGKAKVYVKKIAAM